MFGLLVVVAIAAVVADWVIAGSLTNSYLTWYYVEMLKKVAESQNNTFVITPFDQKLVPMLNVR